MVERETLDRLKTMKVGVLMGGISNEREVSLESGAAALSALKRQGINAVGIDAGRDLLEKAAGEAIDIAFIALHGRYGEDGCAQGALELADIVYTGSGVQASAVAMSKTSTKKMLKAFEIATPDYQVFEKRSFNEKKMALWIHAPAVVKPANGGSSINVSICVKDEEIAPAITAAFESDDEVIVERFIDGALLAVGIVGQTVLPAIEIETKNGFYDYSSKYTPGATIYHIPARLKDEVLKEAQAITMKVHRELRCRGFSRSELIVDKQGKVWFIELNTIPGLTKTSLLPKAAGAAGISFDELVLTILEETIKDEKTRKRKNGA